MAETQPKRLREEENSISETTNPKRQKPYDDVLYNLLEEDEAESEPSREPSHDLSAIFTTLEQELSSSSESTTAFDFDCPLDLGSAESSRADEDEAVKSVMRHLLEASDDELGIPNGDDNNYNNNINDGEINSGENFNFGNFNEHGGLWEIEDEAANYYTFLQSELLFM